MSTAGATTMNRRADGAGSAGGAIPIARLTRLLIALRFRLLRNLLRRRRGSGRAPGLAPLLGLVTSVAYVGLFSQSFGAIVGTTDLEGQAAALSLIAGVIVLGTLAAKAAAGDTVLAGSPENEFWLSRPTSLPSLVMARSLAGAVTDPFGALFLFPVLVAAAITWDLGPGAWLVAAVSSMVIQIGVSAGAQAVQIAVVRYTPPRRRRAVWMVLRLVASLTLAALWMTGTWVLRAPRAMATAVSSWESLITHSPGAWVVQPLLAVRLDQPWGVAGGLAALLVATGVSLGVAFVVARRAGMHGWEEAGAPWAEANPRVVASPHARPLTAATKDLRLILRDRSQLLALIAAPIIFVGIQIFGAAGWDWSTANLRRVAALSFSLCLYMATIGPLAHMQAERRAFWILRTVPVSIGRLMFVKARAWALALGGLAGVSFLVLSAGVTGASSVDRLALALWVAVGAGGMAFIAVGLACQAADLSDEQRPAIGPATIYLFMLVGGLYNWVLRAAGPDQWRGLILYLFVALALWTSGMKQAEDCLDPEAHRRRTVRIGDAAVLALLSALGSRAAVDGARLIGEQGPGQGQAHGQAIAGIIKAAFTILLGLAAGIYLGRRPRATPRLALGPSLALAVVLGAGLALVLRQMSAMTVAALPTTALPGLLPGALLVGWLLVLAEELIWRGAVQRALEEQEPWPDRRWAVAGGAVITLAIGWVAAGGAPLAFIVAAHAVPSLLRAVTGRTSASFAGRAVVITALALFPLAS
jgi:membrane protease YdiL (CAAX protease family)